MRKTLVNAAMCGAITMAMQGIAQATVITFEGGADPAFTYSQVQFERGDFVLFPAESGYKTVANATGGPWQAFNPSAASPSSFFIAGPASTTFTLNSFVIAGAWGNQTLTIEGLNNGSLLFSRALAVTNLIATTFTPNWTGIDELRISTGTDFVPTLPPFLLSNQHWALDNLTINEAVPEPETYAMMLAGLGLLGVAARRRKQKEVAAA